MRIKIIIIFIYAQKVLILLTNLPLHFYLFQNQNNNTWLIQHVTKEIQSNRWLIHYLTFHNYFCARCLNELHKANKLTN